MEQVAQLPLHAIESSTETAAELAQPGAELAPAESSPAEPTSTESAASEQPNAEDEAQAAPPVSEKQRIEEQLQALKRRESELRRALAIAEHPALGDAIRELEGRVHAVSRAEEKLAQGLSKSEERRRETLEKKLASLREKEAELAAQIAGVSGELAALGVERTRTFEDERDGALQQLMVALASHGAAIEGAGLVASALVPELARFLPAVEALAQKVAARN